MTIDLLKAAAGDLQAAAAQLGRDLQRAEDLAPLDVALGLVKLDRMRREVEKLGKKLAARSERPPHRFAGAARSTAAPHG